MADAEIYKAAKSFRSALLKRERAAAVRLIKAYGSAYERISAQLQKLTDQIEEARVAGEMISEAWLLRQERYAALLGQVVKEIGKFSDVTSDVIIKGQREAVNQALDDSQKLLLAAADQAPQISAAFNRVPKRAVENLVGFLSDGSPLKSLLDQLPRNAGAIVARGLTDGVIRGRNPKVIAREIRAGLNGSLTRALKLARTETLRAYREASHQTYQANSDVIDGWIWVCALSPNSCAACVSLHGTFHTLDERMKTHVNDRCTAVPAVKGANLQIEKGSDWFAKQKASVQKEILDSPGAYEAYKSGRLRIEDFVGLRRSVQWGDSFSALTTKRALAGEGRFPGDAVKPRGNIPPIFPTAPQPAPQLKPEPKREPKPETFKQFRSGDVWSISEYGDKKWKQWMRELTSEQKRGVQDYVGDWYENVNAYLREGAEAVNADELPDIRQKVANVDSALNKAKIRENLTMFRGANLRSIHEAFSEGRLIGEILEEPGYWSTSLDEDVGRHFAKAGEVAEFLRPRAQHPALITIKARKGQSGAYVSNINREFHPESPGYDNGEGEILLPRDTKYKVLSARYEDLADGRKLLHVEVEIWQPPTKKKK